MRDKALLVGTVDPGDGRPPYYASSVMLLDCQKLKHWDFDKMMSDLFNSRLDYRDLIDLHFEDAGVIGSLDSVGTTNNLSEATMLLHNTSRITQPWHCRLPLVPSMKTKKNPAKNPASFWNRLARRLKHRTMRLLKGTYKNTLIRNKLIVFSLLRSAMQAV